jgi:phosphate transport system substrate-binding protein
MRGHAKLSFPCTAFAALFVLGAAVGCIHDGDDAASRSDLAGRIDVDGSSSVQPFIALAADRFQRRHPGVAVIVGVFPSRTGGGFERFCAAETDLATASRTITAEERRDCDARGVEYVELQVANDAVVVGVNPANDWADCLTTAELERIWESDSPVDRWSEVRPSFPPEPLMLFGASPEAGTFDYFIGKIVGEEGATRSDYSANEDDSDTVQGVARTEGGLGYFALFAYNDNEDRVKALEIDAGSGCIAPSAETIQSGAYTPLSRPLFVYANLEALRAKPVRAFVEYALDRAVSLAVDAQLVPMTEEQLRRERAELEEVHEPGGPAPAR